MRGENPIRGGIHCLGGGGGKTKKYRGNGPLKGGLATIEFNYPGGKKVEKDTSPVVNGKEGVIRWY